MHEFMNVKLSVNTKCATVGLISVKSCNMLLHMLFLFMYSYLKSVLRYTVLSLNTYHMQTLYLREQRIEDSWLFFEAKRGPRAK
jgi:hypothetical protein